MVEFKDIKVGVIFVMQEDSGIRDFSKHYIKTSLVNDLEFAVDLTTGILQYIEPDRKVSALTGTVLLSGRNDYLKKEGLLNEII